MDSLFSFAPEFWAGIIGAFVGGGITLLGQWLKHQWDSEPQRKLDESRKRLLKHMLDHPPQGKIWRRMETLSRVIGASEDETARLLIEMGARGNESEENVWTWIKNARLP